MGDRPKLTERRSVGSPAARRLGRAFGIALLSVLIAPAYPDDSDEPPKLTLTHKVKAAFLLNFSKFAKWPDSCFKDERSPLVIGVYGKTPLTDFLRDKTEDRKSQGRSIVVKSILRIEQARDCHLLYLPDRKSGDVKVILPKLKKKFILTVGDTQAACRAGTAIGFFLMDKKLRFAVNLQAVEKSGLTLSSQLLKLGKKVEPDKR